MFYSHWLLPLYSLQSPCCCTAPLRDLIQKKAEVIIINSILIFKVFHSSIFSFYVLLLLQAFFFLSFFLSLLGATKKVKSQFVLLTCWANINMCTLHNHKVWPQTFDKHELRHQKMEGHDVIILVKCVISVWDFFTGGMFVISAKHFNPVVSEFLSSNTIVSVVNGDLNPARKKLIVSIWESIPAENSSNFFFKFLFTLLERFLTNQTKVQDSTLMYPFNPDWTSLNPNCWDRFSVSVWESIPAENSRKFWVAFILLDRIASNPDSNSETIDPDRKMCTKPCVKVN